jgi:cytidylate kinase
MTRCARTVIETAAESGECVIVGRGAQCILERRNDTLHVFVWAPRAWRIHRVRKRLPEEADPESRMTRTDRERAEFIRRNFDRDWSDYRLYDLMINSALGDEVAAACILSAVRGDSCRHG